MGRYPFQLYSLALTEEHWSALRLEKGVQAHPLGCSDIEERIMGRRMEGQQGVIIGEQAPVEALEVEVAMGS